MNSKISNGQMQSNSSLLSKKMKKVNIICKLKESEGNENENYEFNDLSINKELSESHKIANKILKQLASQINFNLGIILESDLVNKLQLLEDAYNLMRLNTLSLQYYKDMSVTTGLFNTSPSKKTKPEISFSDYGTATSKGNHELRIQSPLNSYINIGRGLGINELNFNSKLQTLENIPELEFPNEISNDTPFFIPPSPKASDHNLDPVVETKHEQIFPTTHNQENIQELFESFSTIKEDEENKSIRNLQPKIWLSKYNEEFSKQQLNDILQLEEDIKKQINFSEIIKSKNGMEFESFIEDFSKIKECFECMNIKNNEENNATQGNNPKLIENMQENPILFLSYASEEKNKGFLYDKYSQLQVHPHGNDF